MKKYDAVLFDLDGTLMDTSLGVYKSVHHTIKEMDLPELSDETIRSFIGPPIYESFRTHYDMDEQMVQTATNTWRNAYKDIYLLDAVPYEGIYELLEKIRAHNGKLAVTTNKRDDYAKKLLEHFDFTNRFDFILGSDIQNTMKKTDIVKVCLEELGVTDLSKAVLIGDTEHDRKGAVDCGIDFIGVTFGFGYTSKEEIMCAGGAMAADSTEELCRILLNE